MTAVPDKAMCTVRDLGLIDYDRAYALQTQYVSDMLRGGMPSLLLCEHPPVLTMGRSADENHMLISKGEITRMGVALRYVNRGGDITVHAPGQLVVYPILDLVNFGRDLRSYLRQLEQVAIDLLGGFDIVASRSPGKTGVWAGKRKIVSIGIGVRKWISFHGLSINVNTDLNLFTMIKPCGLDVEMTSMSEVKAETVKMDEVKQRLVDCFCAGFRYRPVRSEKWKMLSSLN